MTTHSCHPTIADAHRHVATLNARAHGTRRRYTAAPCRCGHGFIASHDPIAVRARRAAGRGGKRARKWGRAA